MEGIVAERVPSDGPEAAFSVSFEPTVLTIAPSDFEKLAVTITVPEETPAGAYSVAFTLSGQEHAPITLPVEVTAPDT